jgi:ATP-dependent helicase HrpB
MKKLSLPVDTFLPQMVAGLQAHSSMVVIAEPGAGKTTRVPVALSEGFAGVWIVLQPRRWAARLTAQRIAEENGFRLGEGVGYQVRFENRSGKNTRILLMTEGVLLRKMVEDPELRGVAGVILDEFHERSLDLDLSLALLKEIQGSFRPELKIVVMSATLDPGPLLQYLPNSKLFQIPGRLFPVERRYSANPSVVAGVKSVLPESGDVLVFLPGAFEIMRAVRELEGWLLGEGIRGFGVYPLYASLPEEQQREVFRATGRKIICATNIAETSITLPGIRAVVDSGLQKVMRMDPALGFDRLETLRISRAAADQRAGRAGRVSEGVVLRLWEKGEQEQLRHFETPEIQRVNLSRALLFLSEFGVKDFSSFDWFERPKASMLEFARTELELLGFLESGGMTESGRRALKLPLDPAIAAVVIEAEKEGVPHFGARFGAVLDTISKEERIRDEDAFLKRLNQLDYNGERLARAILKQDSVPKVDPAEFDRYERVLVRSGRGRICVGDRVVGRRRVRVRDGQLPDASLLLVAIDQGDLLVSSFVPLRKKTLLEFAEKKRRVNFDEESLRVRAVQGSFFEDLELGAVTEVAATPEESAEALKRYLEKNRDVFFAKFPGVDRFLKRVQFLNRSADRDEIQIPWGMILESLIQGKTKLSGIEEAAVLELFEGCLDRESMQRLENEAPARLEVPSGNFISVEYDNDPPKLSVRLQEVFGWLETPKIGGGKVPVLMELLSPGFKPIQMTRDLKSFWANAYFEVKKELKARYPKHSWPEDPLAAKAVSYRRKFPPK